MNKSIISFLKRHEINAIYKDVYYKQIFLQEPDEIGYWKTFYNYSIETQKGNFLIAHNENNFSLFLNGTEIYIGKTILLCLCYILSLM